MGVAVFTLLLIGAGVHLGRSIAYVVCGAGWVFPDRGDVVTGLPGVLSGDPTAGLHLAPNPSPTTGVLWTSIVAVELLLMLVMASTIRLCLTRWGPGGMPGTASCGEVASLLGTGRLRQSAPVIRPDLYSKRRR